MHVICISHNKLGYGLIDTNGPLLGMDNEKNEQSVPIYVMLAEVHPGIILFKITY